MDKNKNRLIYLLIAILFIWLLILSLSRPNSRKENQSITINEYEVSGFSTDFTTIVKDNKNSIVSVIADNSLLSGFVYGQNDNKVYIVTAYHGVSNTGNINVQFGSSYNVPATLLGFDIYTDIAVLEIESPYSIDSLKIGDSSLLQAGEFVISIGTPSSLEYSSSAKLSMISHPLLSLDNSITYDSNRYNYYLNVIQLDSALKTGYSGSPILNMTGEVVGLNTMSNSDYSFAISSNELRIVADKIINHEDINRNLLGIDAVLIKDMPNYEKTNLNLDIQTINGLYVRNIKDSLIANNAGIVVGDVILKVNDIEINNFNDYLEIIYLQDQTLNFEVLRNNQTIMLGIEND